MYGFGASVTVLPGVSIRSNTVIGAGNIINRDIPNGVIAVGNPSRVLRKITEDDKKSIGRKENEIRYRKFEMDKTVEKLCHFSG